jgi:uncharacterized protein YbaA (DUF1428 family)
MSYVDGFIAAVPNANREKFRQHAEDMGKLFKEKGARPDLLGYDPTTARFHGIYQR